MDPIEPVKARRILSEAQKASLKKGQETVSKIKIRAIELNNTQGKKVGGTKTYKECMRIAAQELQK